MVDIKRLKSIMVLRDVTMEMLAKEAGISTKTLYTRFRNKEFPSEEIARIAKFLEITDPLDIFFPELVT